MIRFLADQQSKKPRDRAMQGATWAAGPPRVRQASTSHRNDRHGIPGVRTGACETRGTMLAQRIAPWRERIPDPAVLVDPDRIQPNNLHEPVRFRGTAFD